jgi:beta-glucosidase
MRGWGLESYRNNPATGKPYTPADRTAIAIKSGTDVMSEFSVNKTITDLVAQGPLNERKHIDPAVTRLLIEQFQLGLFENPYVDAEAAAAKIGKPENRALGMDVQRKSVVLLQNRGGLLPLSAGAKVYTLGFRAEDLAAQGFTVTAKAADADAVLIKVMINNAGARNYKSNDPATGGKPVAPEFHLTDPRTGKRQSTWGAQDPCVYEPDVPTTAESPDGCLDSGLIFGGAFPWEANMLALSDIAKAGSWTMTPSLSDIQAAMREAGDPGKVVISIYFRNPYVLDDASGVKSAGALIATFGVSDAAQLDIISGKAKPEGRLPFALPRSTKSVLEQHPDAPGYTETKDGALFQYGYGLGFD